MITFVLAFLTSALARRFKFQRNAAKNVSAKARLSVVKPKRKMRPIGLDTRRPICAKRWKP